MRPQTNNPDDQVSFKSNPGPGAYEKVDTLTKDGKVFVSKFRYYGATQINPPKSKRFPDKPCNFLF